MSGAIAYGRAGRAKTIGLSEEGETRARRVKTRRVKKLVNIPPRRRTMWNQGSAGMRPKRPVAAKMPPRRKGGVNLATRGNRKGVAPKCILQKLLDNRIKWGASEDTEPPHGETRDLPKRPRASENPSRARESAVPDYGVYGPEFAAPSKPQSVEMQRSPRPRGEFAKDPALFGEPGFGSAKVLDPIGTVKAFCQ